MKLLIVSGILLIVMLPVILLVSFLLRDIKNEKKEEIILVFNKVYFGFHFAFELFLFLIALSALGLALFGLWKHNNNLTIPGFILLPTTLCFVSLPFLINHLLYESKQKVIYHKTLKTLTFKKGDKETVFNLNDPDISILHFDPPVKGRGDKICGGAFGKILISDKESSEVLSFYLYDQYDEDIRLLSHPNLKRVKKQFNFL